MMMSPTSASISGTQGEIGLVIRSCMFWSFSSPSGFFIVRWFGVFGVLEKSKSSLPDDAMVNPVGSFSVNKACHFLYAADDIVQKKCFFAREEVGFKLWALAAGSEEDQEVWVVLSLSFRDVFVSRGL